MDLINKIAYISLGINLVIVCVVIIIFLYHIFQWVLLDNLEHESLNDVESKDYETASEILEELINSTNAYKKYNGYNCKAVLELKKRDYTLAEKYALEAISIMPKESSAYVTLVETLILNGARIKAYYYLLEAISKSYMTSPLCVCAGKLLILDKHYNEAIKMFENAIIKDSDNPEPFVAIAFVYYLTRNNSKAIDYIRQSRKNLNNSLSKHQEINEWGKGLLAIVSGDYKEAKYIFEYYKETSFYAPIFDLILEKINTARPGEA